MCVNLHNKFQVCNIILTSFKVKPYVKNVRNKNYRHSRGEKKPLYLNPFVPSAPSTSWKHQKTYGFKINWNLLHNEWVSLMLEKLKNTLLENELENIYKIPTQNPFHIHYQN